MSKEFRNRMRALPEDPLQGLASDALWQSAWLKAVGLAWSNPELESELMEDARSFLKRRCGYELPEGLTLKIKRYSPEPGERVGWVYDEQEQKHVWYLPQSQLVMFLPPRPGKPEDAPVALADYLATGRSYPFTTC